MMSIDSDIEQIYTRIKVSQIIRRFIRDVKVLHKKLSDVEIDSKLKGLPIGDLSSSIAKLKHLSDSSVLEIKGSNFDDFSPDLKSYLEDLLRGAVNTFIDDGG